MKTAVDPKREECHFGWCFSGELISVRSNPVLKDNYSLLKLGSNYCRAFLFFSFGFVFDCFDGIVVANVMGLFNNTHFDIL